MENTISSCLTIMGIKVVPFESYDHAVRCISQRVAQRQKTFTLAINPEKIYRTLTDSKLKELLNSADIQICDGIGVIYAARILLGRKLKRCTGVQLFFNLVEEAEKKGFKIFLLGASPESNELACSNLLKKHPNLKIVGRQDGYFKDASQVITKINDSQADMLFVAMGSPSQEYWIAENRDKINGSYIMGVGGTFDVISGKAKWAPAFFRKTGTEFLYRLIKEPKRWHRQLVLPKFAFRVLKEAFSPSS